LETATAEAAQAEAVAAKAAKAHAAKVLCVWGEIERLEANGIPAAAKKMAPLLSKIGHEVVMIEVAGEDHGSLKPSIISRGVGFAALCWAASHSACPAPPAPPMPSEASNTSPEASNTSPV